MVKKKQTATDRDPALVEAFKDCPGSYDTNLKRFLHDLEGQFEQIAEQRRRSRSRARR